MDLLRALRQEIADSDFPEALQKTVTFLRTRVPHYNWVGVYMLKDAELVLHAWDGPQATQHIRIPIGQGICGLAAREQRTVIVGDVNADTRYLACFSNTRAEIVVPIFKDSKIIGEIDIDSDTRNAFGEKDRIFLESVAQLLGEKYGQKR